MLHIICNGFSSIFKCFAKCFRCMLQVFQLFQTYVVNVSFGCFKSRSGVASLSSPFATLPWCLLLFSMLVMCSSGVGPHGGGWRGWGESLKWREIRMGRACRTEPARGVGAASGRRPRARHRGASLAPQENMFSISWGLSVLSSIRTILAAHVSDAPTPGNTEHRGKLKHRDQHILLQASLLHDLQASMILHLSRVTTRHCGAQWGISTYVAHRAPFGS
jgi:hypothetical protein